MAEVGEQLVIDLFGTNLEPGCTFIGKQSFCGHVWCEKGHFWTECTTSICGDPPMCAFDEPDNSPEAVKRRLDWIRAHK